CVAQLDSGGDPHAGPPRLLDEGSEVSERRLGCLRQALAAVLAPVAVAAAAPPPGAGTGLIGLAERVSLAGGTLEHGVDPDGAFVLRASLPR
ncbi:MAG: hypothetical protein QOF33_4496, partial [Thermomicrobiales bacterium]|nr:hypothetical protein [Thermomicrobiales bacterium]